MGRRISLNGLFFDYPYSGTWTYARNLVVALGKLDPDTAYTVVTRREQPGLSPGPNLTFHRTPWPFRQSTRPAILRADKGGWEQAAWPLASRGSDLIHSLYFAAPFVHPGRLVVTVHDTITMRKEFQRSRAAAAYARLMRASVRKADAIITVSNHARSEIADMLRFPVDRIFVTYEAPDPAMEQARDLGQLEAVRERYALPDHFVLYLGGTEGRKNIAILIQAWARLHLDGVSLVVVGRFDSGESLTPDMRRLAQELGVAQSVRFVPFITQEDLPALYSMADLFCFPSLYEGFGLPPVEAMACGTPVLAARSSSLPEVLGAGAELVAPADADAWSSAMGRLLGDREARSKLGDKGRAWVKRYSWEATARGTVEVYDAVLGGRR